MSSKIVLERDFKVFFKKQTHILSLRNEKAYGELYKTTNYCCSDHFSQFPVIGLHAKAAKMTKSRNNCVGALELPLDLSHCWTVSLLLIFLILQKAISFPFNVFFSIVVWFLSIHQQHSTQTLKYTRCVQRTFRL